MIDIKKETSSNQTVLYLMSGVEYNNVIIKTIKSLSNKTVCYVTLNKTSDSLKETFKKNKIKTDNIIFIDAISKTIKKVPQQDKGVFYVSNPGALTELSLVINRFLNHNFEYLIFDSLTNMLIYEKKEPVAKFVSSIINQIKQSKTKAVFYALSVKEQDLIIKETSMFVDKVVEEKK